MKKLSLLLYVWVGAALAAAKVKPKGIGDVANHLMEPVGFASDFIYTTCFVIGGSLLFASVIKYIDHRRNPLAVTISTVVFLFIAGLFLVALPFAYKVVNHGTPYTLLR